MKKIAGWVIGIIWPVVTVVLVWYGSECFRSAGVLGQNVTIWKSDGGFSLTEVERIKEWQEAQQQEQGTAGIQDFTAWSEKKGVWVNARSTGRQALVNVLTIYGSSELLLPYGRILHQEDTGGCLIGAETAERLFGSRNAEGLVLYYRDVEFVVRGVVDEPGEWLAVQAGAREGVEFNRITLRRETGKQRRQLAEEYMLTYGITGELLRWDYYYELSWLEEMIPGKWSHFDGWQAQIADKAQDFERLAVVEKSSIELMYLGIRERGLWCLGIGGVMGVMGVWYGIKYFKRKG